MIICICHNVSDRAIGRAAEAGCASFGQLQSALGVATACGKCLDCARETFGRHAAADATKPSLPGRGSPVGRGTALAAATPHRHEPATPAAA